MPGQPLGSLRDRILGLERIPAHDLLDHTGNWRLHPQFQQDALAGVLREVGIAGALLVYKSPAAGGQYVTIDGHLRKAIAPDQEWPCLVLDVDDDEARYLLATHDPLAALAEAGRGELRSLLDQVQSVQAGVQAMLSQLAETSEAVVVPVDSPEDLLSYDETIETEHTCPRCGYEWSGGA